MASYPSSGRRRRRVRRLSQAEWATRMTDEALRSCIEQMRARPGYTGRPVAEEEADIATYEAELRNRGQEG